MSITGMEELLTFQDGEKTAKPTYAYQNREENAKSLFGILKTDANEDNQYIQGKLRNMTGIYLTRNDKMLLLYRQGSKVVNNMWIASAGGHFEEDELNNARACVLRELQEELSITEDMLENLRMRYVVLRNVKGEIRQNYYFFADLKEDNKIDFSSDEGILKWFSIDELSSLEMPFSAKFAIEHYINTGRYTDSLYGGVADGEKVVFTEMRE